MKGDYQKGDEAFYHECGEIYRVKILESGGNKKVEKYGLEVVGISQTLIGRKLGEKFSVDKKRNVSCSGLWQLLHY